MVGALYLEFKGEQGRQSAMVEFVESIRPIWEGITGLPVNLVESSYATWDSLQEALAWASRLADRPPAASLNSLRIVSTAMP